MAAITLSRQLGSEGDRVAEAVAWRLGYRVVRHDLINEAARRAGRPKLRSQPSMNWASWTYALRRETAGPTTGSCVS